MKKLSEIPMEEYICIKDIENLMTKEDFLDSAWYLDKEDVKLYETTKNYAFIDNDDIEYILENLSDNMYENWFEDVLDDILKCPELKIAIEAMNKILTNYPSYCESNEILNDMIEE